MWSRAAFLHDERSRIATSTECTTSDNDLINEPRNTTAILNKYCSINALYRAIRVYSRATDLLHIHANYCGNRIIGRCIGGGIPGHSARLTESTGELCDCCINNIVSIPL